MLGRPGECASQARGYRLVMARSAARSLATSLPEKVATAVFEFVTGPLLENPRRVGKPVDPPLAPACSAREVRTGAVSDQRGEPRRRLSHLGPDGDVTLGHIRRLRAAGSTWCGAGLGRPTLSAEQQV